MKLSPRCYSPFKVLEKGGTTTDRLDLPVDLRIQPVFHESCLKGKWNKSHQLVVNLPPKDREGVLKPKAEEVLERRMKKMTGQAVTELLIKWRGLGAEEASWEDTEIWFLICQTLWTRSSEGGDNVTCRVKAVLQVISSRPRRDIQPSTW